MKIGEELSVIIYLKDDKRMYDVGVKDCWAFNDDDFDHPGTAKVQLTDADGCVKSVHKYLSRKEYGCNLFRLCHRKSKIIGNWRKTYEPGDSGATTIAYTNMTAFKFPDSDNVHLTCNIEVRLRIYCHILICYHENVLQVCEDYCEETCASNSGAVLPTTSSRPPSRGSGFGGYFDKSDRPEPTSTSRLPSQPETTSLTVTTTRPPICYPNNFDSRCPKETQVATFPASEESEGDVLPGAQSTRQPIDETEEDIQSGGYTTRRPYTYQTTYRPSLSVEVSRSTTKKPLCYPGRVHLSIRSSRS